MTSSKGVRRYGPHSCLAHHKVSTLRSLGPAAFVLSGISRRRKIGRVTYLRRPVLFVLLPDLLQGLRALVSGHRSAERADAGPDPPLERAPSFELGAESSGRVVTLHAAPVQR